MRSSIPFIALASLVALAPLGAGCMSQADDAAGTIAMPLTQTGSDGALYHLTGTFEITDATGAVQDLDAGVADASITAVAPPGIAQVHLLDGWSLEKSTDSGATYQHVNALLGSLNPVVLRVLANTPTPAQFQFLVRDSSGTIQITFGVTSHPRELAGGAIIDTGTGDFAGYAAAGAARRFDFAIFYNLDHVDTLTQPDGTKQKVYTAGADALEVYNDAVGVMASQVVPSMTQGYLAYTVAVAPDGTQTATGTYQASMGDTRFDFGPHALDPKLPLDADGFPVDEFFYDPFMPFTASGTLATGPSTMTGTLRLRFIP